LNFQFIEKNELVDEATYLVADGVTGNCSSNKNFGPTYNMGLMIGEASVCIRNCSTYTRHLAIKQSVFHIFLGISCKNCFQFVWIEVYPDRHIVFTKHKLDLKYPELTEEERNAFQEPFLVNIFLQPR